VNTGELGLDFNTIKRDHARESESSKCREVNIIIVLGMDR